MKKIKLTWKQHNIMFKYRKIKFLTYYDIIDDPENKEIEMYQRIRLPVKVCFTLISPLLFIWYGVPTTISAVVDTWKRDSVGADTIDREWFYQKLKELEDV